MRWVISVIAAVLFAVGLPGSAQSGKPHPLSWDSGFGGGSGQWDGRVDQQSSWASDGVTVLATVSNPTNGGCFWDINDHLSQWTDGYLEAGRSLSTSLCDVSEPDPFYRAVNGVYGWVSSLHGFQSFTVSSVSAGLTATVCYSPQGRCFALPQRLDSTGRYAWGFCGHAVYGGHPMDPVVQPVAGSNGGYGVVTTITFTVANPTVTRARDVLIAYGRSSDVYGCGNSGHPLTHVRYDYPFTWTVGT